VAAVNAVLSDRPGGGSHGKSPVELEHPRRRETAAGGLTTGRETDLGHGGLQREAADVGVGGVGGRQGDREARGRLLLTAHGQGHAAFVVHRHRGSDGSYGETEVY